MAKRHLLQDAVVLGASILFAWAIVHYELVPLLLGLFGGSDILASFFAGMFFTSVTTTTPAMAFLGELSLQSSPVAVALVGGLGAVVGDYVIFAFVRDRIGDDIAYLLKRTGSPRFFKLFHRRSFKRLLPFIGGLIIASPLPDELGLTFMGIAKMPTSRFLVISYAFNTVGILLIGLAARALAG